MIRKFLIDFNLFFFFVFLLYYTLTVTVSFFHFFSYVILENLRYFLYPYPPDMPLYFGYKFKFEYMSGGAGYVLSKESVRLFVEQALPNTINCSNDTFGDEDVEMGKCLKSVGVKLGDSRDEFGKERFSPLPPYFLLNPDQNKTFWYYTMSYYEERAVIFYIFVPSKIKIIMKFLFKGLDCCSDSAISFHYVYATDFNVLEYFVYHLKPINRLFHNTKLPSKYSKEEVTKLLDASIILDKQPLNSSIT